MTEEEPKPVYKTATTTHKPKTAINHFRYINAPVSLYLIKYKFYVTH